MKREPHAAGEPGEQRTKRNPLGERLGVFGEQQLRRETEDPDDDDREDELPQRPRAEPTDAAIQNDSPNKNCAPRR